MSYRIKFLEDGGPLLGMHITAIRKFLRDHPDVVSKKYTTSDCNRAIVKPETKGTRHPYITKYLRKKSRSEGVPLVAPATAFVSHAWKYEFASTVVDVMEQHAKKKKKCYFWFDLFTNDQNVIASKDFNWFSNTFRNSIRDIGQVLLVLSPWNDPMPIRRAWCLFEIATALEDEVALSIYLPECEIDLMKAAVLKHNTCLINTLADIDAENAEAKTVQDRNMIFDVIRNSQGGFTELNDHVRTNLRAWYVKQLRLLVSQNPKDEDLKMAVAENCQGLFSQQKVYRVNKK